MKLQLHFFRFYLLFFFIFSFFVFNSEAKSAVSDSAIIAKSQQIIKLLNTINYEKVALIPVYDFTVCDAEVQLQQLQQQLEKTKFIPNDSAKFWLDSVIRFSDIQRTRINQLLANIDDVYYNKALSFYNNNDILNALVLIEKSLAVNKFFVPAYILHAKILLAQKQYDSALLIIDYVQNNIWRNSHHQISYTQLQYAVYWTLLKDAEDALKNQDFNISIATLEKTVNYCKKKYIVCDEQLSNALSRAHFGMFDSYLRIAQKASANSNMRFAENYLLQAIQYREQYADMITITVNFDTLLNKIINVYLQNGLQYIKINDYTNAILAFEKIEQRCKNLSQQDCNDNINNTIHAAKYGIFSGMIAQAKNFIIQRNIVIADSIIADARMFREKHTKAIPFTNELDSVIKYRDVQWALLNIQNGKDFLYKNRIDSALNSFQNALFIARFYKLVLDSALPELFYNTTQKYILNLLEDARLKAWGNKFDTAWRIFHETEAFKNKKILYTDETVDSAMHVTEVYIRQKQCAYMQNQLNNNMEMASRSVALCKFYDATLWLNKAMLIAAQSQCKMDTAIVQQQINAISIPATYQKWVFETESKLQLKQFDEALQFYQQAKLYYTKYEVQQWNITPIQIGKLIPESYTNQDLQALTDKLNHHQFCEECISVLKMLQDREIKISVIKNEMVQCAKIAARQDYESENTQNPDTLLLQYRVEGKWFKPFRETYKKTWMQQNKPL